MTRTRVAAAVLTLAVLLAAAACSSGSSSTSSGAASDTALGNSANPSLNAEAKADLLTAKDLGSGWLLDTSSSGGQDLPISCFKKLEKFQANDRGHAEVSFAQANGLPAVDETLGRFRNAARAKAAFNKVTGILDSCGSFSGPFSGEIVSGSVTASNLSGVGADDQKTYKLSTTIQGTPVTAAIFVARKGSDALALIYIDQGSKLPDSTVKDIAKKAVNKL